MSARAGYKVSFAARLSYICMMLTIVRDEAGSANCLMTAGMQQYHLVQCVPIQAFMQRWEVSGT